MDRQLVFVFLILVIIIILFSKPSLVHKGGSWCKFDEYSCHWDDEDQRINRTWNRLHPRLKRIIMRLFQIKLTGVDVKNKVTEKLKIYRLSTDERLAIAFIDYIYKRLGKGGRVDLVINSEWRRLPRQTRNFLVQLFGLRTGNGVRISRQMIKKLKLRDPETDLIDLSRRLFRTRK